MRMTRDLNEPGFLIIFDVYNEINRLISIKTVVFVN